MDHIKKGTINEANISNSRVPYFPTEMLWHNNKDTPKAFDTIYISKKLNTLEARFEMEMKIIKTEPEYHQALGRLEQIFDSEPGTSEGDELELLSLLIDNYEKSHFPIGLPDPIEAIKFRMEQLNYQPKDLADVIGFRSRVTEILNRKRKLSLNMIRKINQHMHIPTDVLVQKY